MVVVTISISVCPLLSREVRQLVGRLVSLPPGEREDYAEERHRNRAPRTTRLNSKYCVSYCVPVLMVRIVNEKICHMRLSEQHR